MCPGYSGNEWEQKGNPFLKHLADAITVNGWQVVPITREDIRHPGKLIDKGIDILHLHWPSALGLMDKYENYGWSGVSAKSAGKNHPMVKKILNLIRRIKTGCDNAFLAKSIIREAKGEIETWAQEIQNTRIPIVWQQHDLGSHHNQKQGYISNIDEMLHRKLYALSTIIAVHEYSCLDAIYDYYGSKKQFVLTPLGPIDYGSQIPKHLARERLGIETKGKVVSYLGTPRGNRNPKKVAEVFFKVSKGEDVLIVAGQNVKNYLPKSGNKRLNVYDGLLPPETVRDIYCASDFIVNDAERYLTSMVVRNAMTYCVPVVVNRFGSSIDMARNASIFIDGNVAKAIYKALNINDLEFEQMAAEAAMRHNERSWERSGKELCGTYEKLMAQTL